MGSCRRVLRVSAVYPGFSLVDPTGRLAVAGLGGKVGTMKVVYWVNVSESCGAGSHGLSGMKDRGAGSHGLSGMKDRGAGSHGCPG